MSPTKCDSITRTSLKFAYPGANKQPKTSSRSCLRRPNWNMVDLEFKGAQRPPELAEVEGARQLAKPRAAVGGRHLKLDELQRPPGLEAGLSLNDRNL